MELLTGNHSEKVPACRGVHVLGLQVRVTVAEVPLLGPHMLALLQDVCRLGVVARLPFVAEQLLLSVK